MIFFIVKMLPVIDIFAGVGGLSLGAERAGFSVKAAVENDPQASVAHSKNFPKTKHLVSDALRLSGKDILEAANLKKGQVSGVIGGPPCQGFSEMGHKTADDSRNLLFVHFFKLVSELSPAFFLAENVPGILKPQYSEILKVSFKLIPRKYRILPPIIIKAEEFGAPTLRKRVFFIGYDPKRFTQELNESHFQPSQNTSKTKVKEALIGLPVEIDPEWQAEEEGFRQVGNLPDSIFGKKVSGEIPEGVGDEEFVNRYLKNGETSGCLGTIHSEKVVERYERLNFGQRDYISKAPKLDPEGFCPTLRAGTAKDKGSYQAVRPVHFLRPRVITPREAARLQGFPDWFRFDPTKWHSFRQIGNSVSPIVAENLFLRILEKMVQ